MKKCKDKKMNEFIIRELIHDLLPHQSKMLKEHLESCQSCRLKALALSIASEANIQKFKSINSN